MEPRVNIDKALKALAHPGRVDFLIWLSQPEKYFGISAADAKGGVPAGRFELEGLSQSAVSQNLAILQNAGLLSSRMSFHAFPHRSGLNFAVTCWSYRPLEQPELAGPICFCVRAGSCNDLRVSVRKMKRALNPWS